MESDLRQDIETLRHVIDHDLRAPLRTIEALSGMLLEHAPELDEEGRDYLSRVRQAVAALDGMLTSTTRFIDAGRMAAPEEVVGAGELVAEVLECLQNQIRATGARVTVAGEFPRVRVNRKWARAALFELVSNALKFTREGEPPLVELAPVVEGSMAGIAVRDRGPGLADNRPRQAGRLFRRQKASGREGLGSGLTLAWRIAQGHGGDLSLRPRGEGGTEVVITFGAPG